MHHAPVLMAALLSGLPLAAAQEHLDADRALVRPHPSFATVADDLSQVTQASQAVKELRVLKQHAAPPLAQAPEGGTRQTPRLFTGPAPAKEDISSETFSLYSVAGSIARPLYDSASDENAVWTRVRRMKASFGADGFTAYPAFGKRAAEAYAVHFDLASVTIGSEELAFDSAPTGSRTNDTVTLQRQSLREVYHVDLDSIEQTFVFDQLPNSGELVLNIDVDSNLAVLEDLNGIHFLHDTFGGITYGDAFVVDAAGRREAIQRQWTGDSIELTVPAEFLANATFPVTVDPPVTSFVSTAGIPDDSNVDICYAGVQDTYWVAFEDYVNTTQSDVYAIELNNAGDVVTFIAIDNGADDWTTPKIAYHYGANRLMVVASVIDTSGLGSVEGLLIDALTGSTIGSSFQVSTPGALKVHPDISGTSWDSTSSNYFLVAWSTVWTPGVWHQIEYRSVDWDGTFATAVTSATPVGEVHNEPALSESLGDVNLSGDWRTLVWTFDDDNDGLGSIEAQRLLWNGTPDLSAGTFTVASGSNCSHPRVTSRFNRPLLSNGDRPSLVVYEREFLSPSGPGGLQRSIYGRVVTDGETGTESPISWQLEDFDLDLDQREPDVACDGNCFYMIYSEVFWGNPSGTDYDMYMLSGCITDRLDGAEIALAERHENMAISVTPERNGAVATVWDGEDNSISDDGMAVWEDRNVSNGGTIEGSTLEIPTQNQSLVRAVGRQFCDNNPNSGGGQFGRQAT